MEIRTATATTMSVPQVQRRVSIFGARLPIAVLVVTVLEVAIGRAAMRKQQ